LRERLVLASDEYLPLLADLVQGESCPKGEWIATILEFWARVGATSVIATGASEDNAAAGRTKLVELAQSFEPRSSAARRFAAYLRRVVGWLEPRPRRSDEIPEIVRDLALGQMEWELDDRSRWHIVEDDGVVVASIPYGSPTLGIWQRIRIDTRSGALQTWTGFPPRS
jgi:hypothetical protein